MIKPKHIHKRYYSSTPVFWRKLGDSFLLLGTTMTATFAGMEIGKGWIITMAFITAIGKMVTNLVNEEEQPKPPDDAQQPV